MNQQIKSDDAMYASVADRGRGLVGAEPKQRPQTLDDLRRLLESNLEESTNLLGAIREIRARLVPPTPEPDARTQANERAPALPTGAIPDLCLTTGEAGRLTARSGMIASEIMALLFQ